MSAERNLYDLQMERYEIFKAQNPENGKFDVTFEIDGKAIHAHKSILCLISTTFDSMLSDRWLKQNETIKIEGFSFDSFKEFLTFIYSGECKLGNENIIVMIDLADFYSIKVFKKYCENYLSKVELNLENIYQMIEIIFKYSLEQLKNPVIDFASKKIAGFMKSDKFYEIDKPILKEIIKSSNTINHQEELFEAVYKWAEKQTEESLKVENDLDFNETIKEYFSNFIPFIKFELMENGFFIDLVVEKSFLFTNDQLRKILWSRSKVQVRVINAIGKTMKGELQCGVEMKNVTDVIYSQKNIYGRCIPFCHNLIWETKQAKPSSASKLIKNENVHWYLIYDGSGNLVIKYRTDLRADDFLLAEMIPESGFTFSPYCKIEIF